MMIYEQDREDNNSILKITVKQGGKSMDRIERAIDKPMGQKTIHDLDATNRRHVILSVAEAAQTMGKEHLTRFITQQLGLSPEGLIASSPSSS